MNSIWVIADKSDTGIKGQLVFANQELAELAFNYVKYPEAYEVKEIEVISKESDIDKLLEDTIYI